MIFVRDKFIKMLISSLFFYFATSILLQAEERDPVGQVTVYRLDNIIPVEGEPLKNATILVRDGVIERMGKAVIIPDNAKVFDLRGTGSVITPPLVLSHANWLQSDRRGGGNQSQFIAADSLWLSESWAIDMWKEGVGLVAVDPPGSGAPGRTSVIKVDTAGERPHTLVDDLHMKLTMATSASAKKLIRDQLKAAEKAIEGEKQAKKDWEKAREDWEKKQAAEKEKNAKDSEPKKEAKPKEEKPKEEGPPETFTPPKIKEELQAWVEWVRKERSVQVHMRSASDWLHWRQLMNEREEPHEIVLGFSSSTNLHQVVADIAGSGLRVYVPARISYLPYTRNRVNIASEMLAEGCEKLVLIPSSLSLSGLQSLRINLSRMLDNNLTREAALRALTLEPALALGQEEVMGKLVVGGAASFVIWGGDFFDPLTEVDRVIIDGLEKFNRKEHEAEEQR